MTCSQPGWYVVQTQPNAEGKSVAHLERQGFATYLPRYLKRRRHARRVEVVTAPLFPRYLFIRLDDVHSNWLPVRSTLGVAQLVRFGDKYCRLPEGLVQGLMGAEQQRRNLLSAGDAVRVTEGPFKGLEGIYHQPDGSQRVLVLMNLFSRPQSISLPVASVQKAFA